MDGLGDEADRRIVDGVDSLHNVVHYLLIDSGVDPPRYAGVSFLSLSLRFARIYVAVSVPVSLFARGLCLLSVIAALASFILLSLTWLPFFFSE